MFGSKQAKEERLAREAALLEQQERSVADLAEEIGVPRSTIWRDLTDLEDRGILLQEDNGKLSLFRRR